MRPGHVDSGRSRLNPGRERSALVAYPFRQAQAHEKFSYGMGSARLAAPRSAAMSPPRPSDTAGYITPSRGRGRLAPDRYRSQPRKWLGSSPAGHLGTARSGTQGTHLNPRLQAARGGLGPLDPAGYIAPSGRLQTPQAGQVPRSGVRGRESQPPSHQPELID